MYLSMLRDSDRNRFKSVHHVHTRTGDGKELIVLTGVAVINFKWEGGSSWHREALDLGIDIRHILPDDKVLKLDFWAPFVTINAVFNRGESHNSGHAVDTFQIVNPRAEQNPQIVVRSHIAVRDSDAWLHRVAYNVTLVGRFVNPSIGNGPPII